MRSSPLHLEPVCLLFRFPSGFHVQPLYVIHISDFQIVLVIGIPRRTFLALPVVPAELIDVIFPPPSFFYYQGSDSIPAFFNGIFSAAIP